MRALVLRKPASPMQLETLADPVPGPGEAVARVFACGAGLTVQHAVGPDVADLAVGDEVTAYFYLTCGKCRWCIGGRESLCANFGGFVGRHIDGGYADLIKLPARNFLRLPPELRARVFENVMPRVGEGMHFRFGKAPPPFGQKVPVEDEILLAPTE